MFRIRAEKHAVRAFTLVEILVTLAIIGVLSGLVCQIYLSARARTRALRCLANQQQISQALLGFYFDNKQFPADDASCDLAVQLSTYIPWRTALHEVRLPEVYRCPNDRDDSLSNSYEPYYVRRKGLSEAEYFVLGCPRHEETESDSVNLCRLGSPSGGKQGQMRINGEAVSAEASAGSRSMRSGSMSFDDGSTVTITSSAEDYTVTAVASFTMESGRLYTVVRVTGKGEAEFAVTPGSKFEVVSPVAIIGVRGTQFRVITDVNYAGVDLLSGSVEVWDRLTGSTTVYTAPATFYVGPVPAPPNLDYLCIHCKKRCRDGAHGQRCPLHVGKPENIGTAVCVECPRDCKPAEYLIVSGSHCKRFCPMHKDNAVMDPDPADNPVPLKLTLAHHKDATWKVTNPNSFKVYFVWEIVGAGSMTNNDVSGGSIRDIDVGDIYANAVRLTYHLPDLGVQTTEATR